MKNKGKIIQKYMPWIFAMFVMDAFFSLLFWLADAQRFVILSAALFLGTFLLFLGILCFVLRKEQKRREAFQNYIQEPNEWNEEKLTDLCSAADSEMILLIGRKLQALQQEKEELHLRTQDYEEYVELWAHETKTPLSLLTVLMDNRREELSPEVRQRLDHIRNRMQEYVEHMLFYARLKSGKKDYRLEQVDLLECLQDVLSDYQLLLKEHQIEVKAELESVSVYTDRRGLRFILSQIISNAMKYQKAEKKGWISIQFWHEEGADVLAIRDNGIGVRANDLPYIFEKGFTGDSGIRGQKATGMGLYLAKETARDLMLSLEAESVWGEGFVMKIQFPVLALPEGKKNPPKE